MPKNFRKEERWKQQEESISGKVVAQKKDMCFLSGLFVKIEIKAERVRT